MGMYQDTGPDAHEIEHPAQELPRTGPSFAATNEDGGGEVRHTNASALTGRFVPWLHRPSFAEGAQPRGAGGEDEQEEPRRRPARGSARTAGPSGPEQAPTFPPTSLIGAPSGVSTDRSAPSGRVPLCAHGNLCRTVRRYRTPPPARGDARHARVRHGQHRGAAGALDAHAAPGWNDGPGVRNLVGIPILAAGVGTIVWSAASHATEWRQRDWRVLKLDPDHLLTPSTSSRTAPTGIRETPSTSGTS